MKLRYLLILLYLLQYLNTHAMNQKHIHIHKAHLADMLEDAKEDLKKYLGINSERPLQLAVFENNIDKVRSLINPLTINSQTRHGNSPVYIAARLGHVNILNLLISANANINMVNYYGKSPLYIATLWGHKNVVETLLKNRAEVDITDNARITPLMVAVKKNFTTIAKLLIYYGADVNHIAYGAYTPLICSIQTYNLNLMKYLIENGAKVSPSNLRNVSVDPFKFAISKNNTWAINVLINAGYSDEEAIRQYLNSLNTGDFIHVSHRYFENEVSKVNQFKGAFNKLDYQKLDKLLQSEEINLNMQNPDGSTMLTKSINNRDLDHMFWLLDKGADIYTRDTQGNSPYILSLYNNNYHNLIKWFKSLKLKFVEAIDAYERTKNICHLKLIKLILKIAPQLINLKLDNKGNSILHVAVIKQLNFMIYYLLCANNNAITIKNNDNLTALELATCSYNNSLDGFKYFLEQTKLEQPKRSNINTGTKDKRASKKRKI